MKSCENVRAIQIAAQRSAASAGEASGSTCPPATGFKGLSASRWLACLIRSLALRIGLFATLFLGASLAHAQVEFTALAPTNAGGVADANGTWNSGINFTVLYSEPGDSVKRVELREGSTVLSAVNYTVRFTPQGVPISDTRSGTLSANLAPGTHQIYLRATTQLGKAGATQSFTVTVTQGGPPPVVTLTSPSSGQVFYFPAGTTPQIPVAGSASSSTASISKIDVLANGGVYGTASGASISASVPLWIGPITITLRALDSNGIAGTSAGASVQLVAVSAPTASLSQPANGAVVPVGSNGLASVRLVGSASATGGSITKLEALDGATVVATVASGSLDSTVNMAPGTHSIVLRATNNVGVASSSAATTITVPQPPLPTVTMINPAGTVNIPVQSGQTGSVSVSGSTSVASGSVTKVEVLDGSTVIATANASSINTPVTLSIGTHNISLRATTSQGAIGTSGTSTVNIVGVAAPTVSMSAPVNNLNAKVASGLLADVAVTGSASSAGGSISKIEILDGGVVLKTEYSSPVNTTLALGVGTHTIALRATNNVGVATTTQASTVTIQAVNPPVVNMTTPNAPVNLSASVGSTASLQVKGSASATNGTIVQIEVLNGGTAIGYMDGPSFDKTIALAPGNHSIALRAYNNFGVGTTSPAVPVTVKAIPLPSVSMTAPTNPTHVAVLTGSNANVRVTGSASNVDATITKLEVLKGGVVVASANSSSIDTTVALAAGSHNISLRATNSAGGVSVGAVAVVNVAAVTVSMTKPTDGLIAQSTDGVSATVQVTGNASSGSGSITKLEVLDGGMVLTSINAASIDTPVTLGTGAHSISLRATHSLAGTITGAASSVTVAKTPTLEVTRTPTTLNANEPFQISWTSTDATSVGYSCTGSSADFSASRTGLAANSQLSGTAAAAWTTTAPVCTWTAYGNGSNKTVTDTMTTISASRDASFVSQTVPTTMEAGRSYTVSVTLQNTGNVSWTAADGYKLGSQNAKDNQTWRVSRRVLLDAPVAPGAQKTISFTVNAPATPGSYNFQWQMLQEGGQWFGAMTPNLNITVTASTNKDLKASLSASPSNVRVIGSATAAVTLTGSGTHATGQLARIELYKDSGDGYIVPAEAVKTATDGAAANLSLSQPLNLAAGVYRFMLRSVDTQGNVSDTKPVLVNVTNSTLLGTIDGVRIDGLGIPKLTGWSCQDSSAEALTYKVFMNAPTVAMGGTEIGAGVANLSNDPNHTAVQASCHTPGVGHHFSVDLKALNTSVSGGIPAGTQLFVQASTAAGSSIVLTCADNSCSMPGALRIGLSTPANNDRYQAPATVFARVKISHGTGPFDEAAISVNGEWIPALPDAAANSYYVIKTALPSSATPYPVVAKVRQGNTTLYSTTNLIYVDAAGSAGITLDSPSQGATASAGMPVALSATPTGPTASVVSVKFMAGQTTVAGYGIKQGSSWKTAWVPAQAGTFAVKAIAYDANGAVLAQSTSVSVTVSGSNGPSASTPLPVSIAPPHLGNADAGSLPGDLEVSASGAATYGVPIAVPPGSAGLAPQLALNYSSQGTNGIAGLGWSLSGLSSVHRCGKTIAQDGVNDRIRFANSDRLCLDGKRLVLTGAALTDDSYWADGAEFRTEIDSFSRIKAIGPVGSRSYKVEAKDGRVMTYGAGSSTVAAVIGAVSSGEDAPQPQAKNGALSWAIDRIEDRAGNFISFSYTQDSTSGEHLPAVVRYGGAGLSAHAAVKFDYEARPDAWKRFVDEARNDQRSRLSKVRTFVGSNLDGDVSAGTWVQELTLSYEQSPTSGRSLLNALQACARNPNSGASECLPATSFSWGKPDPAKSAGFVSRGNWPGAPILTTWAAKQLDEKYSTIHYNSQIRGDFFALSDFNNDGRTDVLEKRVANQEKDRANSVTEDTQQTSYRYFHNNGAGFTAYTYKLDTNESFVVNATGDVNGDGAPDLIVWTPTTGAQVCLSPLAAGVPTPGNAIVFSCNAAYKALGDQYGNHRPYVADVAGDGRASMYGKVQMDGTASYCSQGSCTTDPLPPRAIIGLEEDPSAERWMTPVDHFPTFELGVDFAGTGKQSEASWSRAMYFARTTDQEGSGTGTNSWVNTKARVSITGMRPPGSVGDRGNLATFSYPDYKPMCGGIEGSGAGYDSRQPYAFDQPANAATFAGDFNGSGYSSLAFGKVDYIYPGAACPRTVKRADLTVCLSTGRALDCGVRQKYSQENYRAVRGVGNFVGDGAPALLVETLTPVAGDVPAPSGNAEICRLMGDDTTGGTGSDDRNMVCTPWTGITLPKPDPLPSSTAQEKLDKLAVDALYFMDLLGTGRDQLVIYRTGKFDAAKVWQEDGRWEVYEAVDRAVAGQALDRIHQVTNGLGSQSSVEYLDGPSSGVVKRSASSGLSYPQRATSGMGKIVARLHKGNGVAGARNFGYRYFDPGIDLAGRGSLGFAAFETTDLDTGIVSTQTFEQVWPLTGMLRASSVVASGCALQQTSNSWSSLTTSGGATFAYLAASSSTERDLVGCPLVRTSTLGGASSAQVQYDNNGNLLNSKTTISGGGKTFTDATVNNYYAADTSKWLIGLLENTAQTKTQSSDGRSITRSKAFTYDAAGRVATETLMPGAGDVSLRMTTTLDRSNNGFGLVGQKTQQWTDPLTNQPVTRFDTTVFDAKGRFPVTLTNAAGHSETRSNDAGSGAPTLLTGPNLLSTHWQVDGFGRVTQETRADGNETRQYRKRCQGDCPAGAAHVAITEQFHGADRIAVPSLVYSDSAGHALRALSWGFDGREIVADSRYDSLGRLWEADQPHYGNEAARLAKQLEYDLLGRVTNTVTPDEQGVLQSATSRYQGLVTVHTNAKNQSRTDTKDAAGRLEQVLDTANGSTQFGYDPFGNLSRTVDPNTNVIQVFYDDLGRRTQLVDPDLGTIDYRVDAAGRVRRQVSPVLRAKNQAITMDYDALDRMTARYEPDLESHWDFDTASMGIGQLAEAYTGTSQAKDYRRVHSYDSLGRPSTTTQKLFDASYASTPSYDAWGRPITLTLQRGSDAAKVFDTRYNDKGFVARIERGGLKLWEAQTQDASHRVTLAQLGNGLLDAQQFSPYTGRIDTATLTATVGGELRLQQAYGYDALGNVLQRGQYWDSLGFSETFSYDALNRIEWSEVSGQSRQSFSYDAAGNLLSKTGVGTGSYVYPAQGAAAVRPHAVQSIPGLGSFAYDDNGNLTGAPGGRSGTWTSFDMPLLLSKGTQSSRFVYGTEHQRTRQIKQDGSLTVYAGVQEVELDASSQVQTIKTYWPQGLGVEIDKPNQATELHWVHHDRIGSAIAISDAAGQLKEKLAFDAWGKRRTLEGEPVQGNPAPDALDGQVDNKGFTGHEMLDALDLVHMNGRIYEPAIARFLSGDPLIQDPTNGQGYNRYSYVLNNPTNFTDPTGFATNTTCVSDPSKSGECGNDKPSEMFGKGGWALAYKHQPDAKPEAPASAAGQPAPSAGAPSLGTQADGNGNLKKDNKGGGGFFADAINCIRTKCSAPDSLLDDPKAPPNTAGTRLGAAVVQHGWDAPSLIPVVGDLWAYGRALIKGDGQGMLLATGTLALNLASGGTEGTLVRAEVLATKGLSEATSVLRGSQLREYYRQLEKYGEAGARELQNGRHRFYSEITPARTPGEMAGARLVREWNPGTGATRTWYETVDQAGRVRSVAPKPVTESKNHRIFDEAGNYMGRR